MPPPARRNRRRTVLHSRLVSPKPTIQSGYRIPPHPAPKQHGAGLSPERARQDRPVRLRLAPWGLSVTHIYASSCHSERSEESLFSAPSAKLAKTTEILRYAQNDNRLVRNAPRQGHRSVWLSPRPLGERPGPRPQLFVALAPGEGAGLLHGSS